MSGITEHLRSYQPGHTSANHNHPLGLRGPIEAQGHDLEQHLIVGIVHTFLKGTLAIVSLPVQGGHQAEEDGDQAEEVPGWREEDGVSGEKSGLRPPWPCAPPLLLTYPTRP